MNTRSLTLALGLVAVAAAPASAQLFTLTKEQLIELTSANPFERFADGRPKVPDSLLERAKGMSAEEVWSGLNSAAAAGGGRGGAGGAYRNQYEDGFQVLHPKMKLAGRAFTVQFMPQRPDLDGALQARQTSKNLPRLSNQYAIDMLQPGDVLVVDLFGKGADGTIVGDNLFYYVMKATKNTGMVIDGAIRDLAGIQDMLMPAYFRKAHPTALTNVTLTGINIPVRIGNVTVMPGDLVFGDAEGVYFIPPQFAEKILDAADEVHVHDEWTRKKFDEGKYKSSEIYGSPRDPALRKEYEEYKAKRLAEIRKK